MIAYLDCSTGVSGDKLLGALLDAGSFAAGHGDQNAFGPTELAQMASKLAPEVNVVVERVSSHGISALSVRVSEARRPSHRTWSDIRDLLAEAPLPEPVRQRSLDAFRLLAEVEAHVHGTSVDAVHFHEVGALDAIVDIVGVCAAIEALQIESLTCSPIATGWGTVEASHGVLPVPAPATAALLVGAPTIAGLALPGGGSPGELTTPTGAALVAACVSAFGPSPAMTPLAVGYGAGTRDIGHPNVCRLTLGRRAPEPESLTTETVTLLETNVDHISPEAAAVAAEQLLAEGALDVWTAPITMKKGRAAFTLSVLVATHDAERFAGRVVALTGTLGLRRRDLQRWTALREATSISTPWGPVRVKIGAGRTRAEADDVARIARENGVAFGAVEAEISALLALELPDT